MLSSQKMSEGGSTSSNEEEISNRGAVNEQATGGGATNGELVNLSDKEVNLGAYGLSSDHHGRQSV